MNIEPIRLLSGSHADTGTTGHGCAMNVIAYLNGETRITDESPCVCVTVRPILIWLNDYMYDSERQMLLPIVLRALGSADQAELTRRASLAVEFANEMRRIAAAAPAADAAAAARYANAARYADADAAAAAARYADAAAAAAADAAAAARYANAARYAAAARYADAAADADAAAAARYAADAADAAAAATAAARYAADARYANAHQQIVSAALRFLDAALPPSIEPAPVVVIRAEELVRLQEASAA